MRLVELHLDAGRPIDLELHDRLTVVVADEQTGRQIAALLGRAYILAGTEVTGTMDGGGFLTPLDPTAVVAQALDGDGLLTLTPADLPPPDTSWRERARDAALAEISRLQPIAEQARATWSRHQRVHDATVAAVAAGEDELRTSTERLDDLGTQARALEVRPRELVEERNAAVQALDAARVRIEELRAVQVELRREVGPSGNAAHLRIGDDTVALTTIVDRAAALGGIGSAEHADVRAWLVAIADGSATVHPRAEELLRASAEIEEAWERAAAAGVEGEPTVVEATSRRDELERQRELLARLARSGVLGDTAKSEIESAHAAVVASNGRGHEQAVRIEAEDAALARYGFDSYLDFTIATSTRSVGQKAEAKLGLVTEELQRAERTLVDARDAAAERLARLADQREPMRVAISEFLGFRPDGPAAPALAAVPAVPDVMTRLGDLLESSIEQAQDEVRRYGEAVSDLDEERDSLADRADELTGQRAQVERRIAEIEAVLASAVTAVRSAEDRIVEASTTSRGIEAELAAAHRTCDELEDVSAVAYTRQDLPAVTEVLLSRLDPWSPQPRPVLLHDTAAPLGAEGAIQVLAALRDGADRSQLIYLTDDADIRSWAQGLDPHLGSCVVVARSRWAGRFTRRGAGRQRT